MKNEARTEIYFKLTFLCPKHIVIFMPLQHVATEYLYNSFCSPNCFLYHTKTNRVGPGFIYIYINDQDDKLNSERLNIVMKVGLHVSWQKSEDEFVDGRRIRIQNCNLVQQIVSF